MEANINNVGNILEKLGEGAISIGLKLVIAILIYLVGSFIVIIDYITIFLYDVIWKIFRYELNWMSLSSWKRKDAIMLSNLR